MKYTLKRHVIQIIALFQISWRHVTNNVNETELIGKSLDAEVDRLLRSLSKLVTTDDNLTELGITLNIMDEDIHILQEENRQSIFEAAYKLLQNWKMRICKRAILEELRPALKQCKLVTVLPGIENELWL